MARHVRARRGVTLPFLCIMLTAILGGVALAVDLGRLYLTATEVQAAADAGALAAGRVLQQYQPHSASYLGDPRYGIMPVLARNHAAGRPVESASATAMSYDPVTGTLTPVAWSGTVSAVQVKVSATPTFIFGGATGVVPPQVSRTATAWVASVNGARCVRPIGIPYTRWIEGGRASNDQDSTYTRQHTSAPDLSLSLVASVQPIAPWNNTPSHRTYTAIPQWQPESAWKHHNDVTHLINGRWWPIDFTGGGVTPYTTFAGAPPTSSSCQAAQAQDGVNELPLALQLQAGQPQQPTDTTTLLASTATGMGQLCHRVGSNTDAHCYDSTGAVGVRTRVAMVDSVQGPTGSYVLQVREVALLRVMCYFRSTADVCAPTRIADENGTTSSWQLLGNATSDYPAGTIVVILDGPTGTDPGTDLILGAKPGFTQRVFLVR